MKYFNLISSLFLTFISCNVIGQVNYDSTKVSGLIQVFAKSLAKEQFVSLSLEDGKVIEPERNKVLAEFILRSKEYELIELTNHPNPIIRCYSFTGLYYSGTAAIIEVLQSHINDTTLVTTRQGCVEGTEKTIDVMMDLARGGRKIVKDKMTRSDYDKLTEILKNYR